MNASPQIRIGIDVGGTFTDFILFRLDSGQIESLKLLSTPERPAQAVVEGLAILLGRGGGEVEIVHGSTVATNALIERKGTPTALITTAGFKDVLQIGRQNRPALYDLAADPPAPLVSEMMRLEVNERVDSTGTVLMPMAETEIDQVVESIRSTGARSVAISLLFSFLNDRHELALASATRAAGIFTTASSEILPEFREYERTSTTVVNAYVSPILEKYLAEIGERATKGSLGSSSKLRVMQSNGGAISLEEASKFGARCILSGPAGGVIGARQIGKSAGRGWANDEMDEKLSRLITFDMGGTSTDVSLIDGTPSLTTENIIGSCPINLPMLDIHTIGAGGGSIARVDRGGALRVGPESAGAYPGPACYGRGTPEENRPTVTDANLALGRILPEYFLGGKMELYPQRAVEALDSLARSLNLDLVKLALGVIEVVNAHMERALRVISVERGHDPQDYALVSFGGAGGLHAAELARRLGIPRVIIPPMAATLSAFGLLVAEVVKDYSRTAMLPGVTSPSELGRLLDRLAERGLAEVAAQGVPEERISCEQFLDLRYKGQSYELTVPFSQQFRAEFSRKHQEVYGFDRPASEEVEIVNLRVRVSGHVDTPEIKPRSLQGEDPSKAFIGNRPVYFRETPTPTPCYLAEALQPGNRILGPALIARNDTVILLPEKDQIEVDAFANLLLTVGG
jgi:N-methylhydantoinase A